MGIISFAPEKVLEFIPEYGENRDSEDPCVIKLYYVPYVKVQKYARLFAAKTQDLNNNVDKITEVSQSIQKQQFCENVVGISGFFIGSREVTDAAELYEEGSQALIIEILQAMESPIKLSEGLRGG